MEIVVFSAKRYDRTFFEEANARHGHALRFVEARLTCDTAALSRGAGAVCAFVNDQLGRDVLEVLAAAGTRLVALRSAGFNHVDLAAADALGVTIVRVPGYSPHAVAEHTVALVLALDRKIHRAYLRVREGNFALDGLLGQELHGRTVGIVGTGRIGAIVARILAGFGCRLLAVDPVEHPACLALGVRYVPLPELLAAAEIVTLQCPLTPETRHLIDAAAVGCMRRGAMLVNTSRGAVVDTRAVIAGLKSGHLGALGLDVYEEEGGVFFEDRSATGVPDDTLARLLTFPNVIVTGHQGFFTRPALEAIAETTLANVTAVERGARCANEVRRA